MTFSPTPSLETSRSESSKSDRRLPSQKLVKNHFQELMRSEAVDDHPKKKNLFSLVSDQEALFKQTVVPTPCPQHEAPFLVEGTHSTETVERTPSFFSSDVYLFFEQLCSKMIIQASSHSTETTLVIDNPHSLFFGTEITIKEFSTAPKVFNIEVLSHPTAIQTIESHSEHLLCLFRQEHFPFSVHRFDTHIRQETEPLVSFNPEMGEDEQEKKEEEK